MGRGLGVRLFGCWLLGMLVACSPAAAAPRQLLGDGSSPRGQAAELSPVTGSVAPAGLSCGEGRPCQERWQGVLSLLVASCCVAGILYIVRRAQRPTSQHLVSLLVALDASGHSIRGRLTQLARRARPDDPDGLRHWVQRSCALLLDCRRAWTHAGTRGPLRLDNQRAFARLRAELSARDEVHRGAYPGMPSYTVIALLVATREPPPALLAPGPQQLDDFLRVLSRLRLQAFDVLCLPGQDRRMTLRELIEHYPELFPLDVQLSRAGHD
ncbi:MAG TPA: DUF1517 domain-containing protein [Polyangiales bacterium]